MGDGYNFRQLKNTILALSKASDWEVARKEWSILNIFDADEPETCSCGHYPIIEVCVISNQFTSATTHVGNSCVKRFLGLRSDRLFNAIKRIRKDETKSLNADAISFFRRTGLLSDWEYDFLQDTMRKRDLTDRQLKKRRAINQMVLVAVRRRGLVG